MNTKLHLYVLWGVLSFGLLLCAVVTHGSPNNRTRKVFKLDAPKPKPKKLSGYSSIHRTPSDRSPVLRRRTKDSGFSPGAGTSRAESPTGTRAEIQSDFAYVPDVSLTCSTSDFVLRVKPGFYGLGADADELTLGGTCRSTGVLRPYGDLLFTYPLTACDAVRHRGSQDYLIYKYVLRYEPSPKRFPTSAHPIEVDIECRYPRNHHVYQLSVQPTWETVVVRKRLKGSLNNFHIELMDGSWSSPVLSQVYQLGAKIHFQVSAHHLSPGEKIYINSCYAKPSLDFQSDLKYIIIDHLGCMLDSKTDPEASHFVSRTDGTLRFSLKAFQFISDPEREVSDTDILWNPLNLTVASQPLGLQISVHCTLFVTSEDPGPTQKSCTYGENGWKALTGDDSICECCDSQCVTSKSRRAMMEGSVSSSSLLVSDQPIVEEDGFLSMTSVSTTREDKATGIQLTDVRRHDAMQGRADFVFDDEEEQQPDGDPSVPTEPDLKDLGLEDLVEENNETFSNQFEDLGSGNSLLGEYLESEGEGGGVNEISEAQEKEVLARVPSEANVQTELASKVSEEREKTKNEAELKPRNDSHDSQLEDVGEDGRQTWYFWK